MRDPLAEIGVDDPGRKLFVRLYASALNSMLWVSRNLNTRERATSLATFFDVFPGGTVWSNDVGGKGYELVVLGGDSTIAINADEIQKKLNRRDHVNVVRSLQEAGFQTAIELLATQDGRAPDLAPWLTEARYRQAKATHAF